MKRLTLLATFIALLFAVPAQAYVVYTDEATFLGDISGLDTFTEGFESTSDWPGSGVNPNTLTYGSFELTWEGETSEGPANLVGSSNTDVPHTGDRGLFISGNEDWEAVGGELTPDDVFYGMGFWVRPHRSESAAADGVNLFIDDVQLDLNGGDSGQAFLFDQLQYYFIGIIAEQGESFEDFFIQTTIATSQNIFLDDFTFLTENPNQQSQNEIPVPGAVWLLGSGLLGLIGFRRRFKF